MDQFSSPYTIKSGILYAPLVGRCRDVQIRVNGWMVRRDKKSGRCSGGSTVSSVVNCGGVLDTLTKIETN